MILYALACDSGHDFESWFPNSAAYDAQAQRGFVTCPFCGSAKVEKQIMAPAVARKDKGSVAPTPEVPAPPPVAPPPQQLTLMSEPERELRAMVKALREHVVRNADYVGKAFADEARKMHYGEIERRSIYGEANAADTKALIEEGIEVHPLPIVPDERN
ncbi:MAG TPA: DUF1178 family protein [Beijerinckiaceae bacterium]|nr:DUF1178 family protein [Beijerinckiaceae bacterium]